MFWSHTEGWMRGSRQPPSPQYLDFNDQTPEEGNRAHREARVGSTMQLCRLWMDALTCSLKWMIFMDPLDTINLIMNDNTSRHLHISELYTVPHHTHTGPLHAAINWRIINNAENMITIRVFVTWLTLIDSTVIVRQSLGCGRWSLAR